MRTPPRSRAGIYLSAMVLALSCFLCANAADQDKAPVAEGEYTLHSPSGDRTVDHWRLYAVAAGGYRLHSEITSPDSSIRATQAESLTADLTPTSYEITFSPADG